MFANVSRLIYTRANEGGMVNVIKTSGHTDTMHACTYTNAHTCTHAGAYTDPPYHALTNILM